MKRLSYTLVIRGHIDSDDLREFPGADDWTDAAQQLRTELTDRGSLPELLEQTEWQATAMVEVSRTLLPDELA